MMISRALQAFYKINNNNSNQYTKYAEPFPQVHTCIYMYTHVWMERASRRLVHVHVAAFCNKFDLKSSSCMKSCVLPRRRRCSLF